MKRPVILMLLIALGATGCAVRKHAVRLGELPKLEEPARYMVDDVLNRSGKPRADKSLEIVRRATLDSLQKQGVLASSPETANREVLILVEKYRMRHKAIRLLFGLFAGGDHIASRVIVSDAQTDEALAGYNFSTFNFVIVYGRKAVLTMHGHQIAQTLLEDEGMTPAE